MSQSFTDLMTMAPAGPDRLVAAPSAGGGGFLFGGFTMAMALTAAGTTVGDGLVPMSLRCSFPSFGRWGSTDIEVEEVSTSRSFANRRLRLSQEGKLVAAGDVAFHRPEAGPDLQDAPAPEVPGPDELVPVATRFGTEELIDPIELRALRDPEGAVERLHPYWGRVRESLGEDPLRHAAGLAFMSDYVVIFSPFEPGSGQGEGMHSFTLEHTLWFHRPFVADRWLLFDCRPMTQSQGRFVSRGTVHDERGLLVASFIQEGFIRRPRPPAQA